jgi:hypothetical protein
MKSQVNLTPYNKIFRETHLLRNVREKYFNLEGWVQGNNLNIIGRDESDPFYSLDTDDDTDEEEATYKGAILAEPSMNANVGTPILGAPSNVVFMNAVDMDMSAFYPSIKIASNMDPLTLLYKAEFNNEEFISAQCENRSLNTIYQEKDKNNNIRKLDITGECVNSYVTDNPLSFGYSWLNLPSITQLTKIVMRELGTS